jgi:hypothetical protein
MAKENLAVDEVFLAESVMLGARRFPGAAADKNEPT